MRNGDGKVQGGGTDAGWMRESAKERVIVWQAEVFGGQWRCREKARKHWRTRDVHLAFF